VRSTPSSNRSWENSPSTKPGAIQAAAERLMSGVSVDVFGFTLHRVGGDEYGEHARHFRCRVKPDGLIDPVLCSTVSV